MHEICEINRRATITTNNKMPSDKSTNCHNTHTDSKGKMSQSNCHISHKCGNIPTNPGQSVFMNETTPNISIISTMHWQFSAKFFNRKWIYRYLLTLFILMYAINNTPILLSNAQIIKSNRTSAAITQNFNNKIISNSGTSSVTQKTSRNNRSNVIRKEHLNSNADGDFNERPSCPSCSMMKEVEADNLRSFKNHILQRLQLERAPNISKASVATVSESVLADFYNKYGERYIRRPEKNHENMDEMMSDEPKDFRTDKNKIGEDDDEDDVYSEFFSSTQSIYSFPDGKYTKLLLFISNVFCTIENEKTENYCTVVSRQNI